MSYSKAERREMAQKLRNLHKVGSRVGCAFTNLGHGLTVSLAITVLPDLDVYECDTWYDAMCQKLADYIDPDDFEQPERTCQMVSAFDTDELEDYQEGISFTPEDTLAYMCKGCGFDFRYERGLYPKYCPNCGAKVVG